jgi:hypothetical protein
VPVIHQLYAIDLVEFVIVKHFYIKVVQQVQIYLVPVIADIDDKSTFGIEHLYLFGEIHTQKITSFHRDIPFTYVLLLHHWFSIKCKGIKPVYKMRTTTMRNVCCATRKPAGFRSKID